MLVSWISFSLNIFILKLVCYTSIPFLHASLFHIISWEKLTSEMIFSLRKRKPNTKYPLQKKEFVFCSLSVYIFSFLTSIFLPLKKQTLKKQRYRFSLIVNELRMADLVPYKTTLMAFINCIIVANEELEDRTRVRNEFIGGSKIFTSSRDFDIKETGLSTNYQSYPL